MAIREGGWARNEGGVGSRYHIRGGVVGKQRGGGGGGVLH
jgi:hypothetical protein